MRLPRPARALLRLVLLGVVILGLAPGTFVRSDTGARSDIAEVAVVPLAARAGVTGALPLTGAWELSSAHGWFGGFSALVAVGETRLIAGSDRGWLLDLDLAGPAPRAVAGSFRFAGVRSRGRGEVLDLESLARDPATGTLWGAFENANLVTRFAGAGRPAAQRRPREMAKWGRNRGAETMERLADGRFLVIAEGAARRGDDTRPGLLFARDPTMPGVPLAFTFRAGRDYDPVDAAQLPDGRVLILLRRVEYALPVRFDTAIMIADPGDIRAGQTWRGRVIQRLSGAVFGENFEGIAFVPAPGDPARGAVWLIGDDNFSVFQRTLLVRLAWDGTNSN